MSVEFYILTRFNLRLWPHDKWGKETQTSEWLAHRFELFEKCCLPSIAGQSCKDFVWVALMDEGTPEEYKNRMESYRQLCPQLTPVYVPAKNSRDYMGVSRSYVRKHSSGDRVISTYFDNDDALNVRFVEETRALLESAPSQTFLYYDVGVQYWPSLGFANRIKDVRNHFVSVVEDVARGIQTIYGYGSHAYIEKIPNVKVIHSQKDFPMWCEVAHERNKGNDAYFLCTAHPVKEKDLLFIQFAISESLKSNPHLRFIFQYFPRYCKNFVRRAIFVLRGRPWWK